MRLDYGILNPFRFYEKIEHQNRFRNGATPEATPLFCPAQRLLPFQIKRSANASQVIKAELVYLDNQPTVNLLASFASDELELLSFSTFDYIIHFGALDLVTPMPTGSAYVVIEDGTNTWFSEVIKIVNFNPDDITGSCIKTKIKYTDTCNVGDIYYKTTGRAYYNVIYFDVEVGNPEPIYTEGAGDSGDISDVEYDFMKLQKQYNVQPLLPEFLNDAVELLPLHLLTGEVVFSTSKGYQGTASVIEIEPSYEDAFRTLSATDINFITESILKTNCCDLDNEQPLGRCIRTGVEVVAALQEGQSNWNNAEYQDENGDTIPLTVGDLVLGISVTNGPKIYTYTGSGYQPSTQNYTIGSGLIVLNTGGPDYDYWYYVGGTNYNFKDVPVITDVLSVVGASNDDFKVLGTVWNECNVEVYTGGTKVATTPGASFNVNGVSFTRSGISTQLVVKAVGINCDLGQSAPYELPPSSGGGVGQPNLPEGIGAMAIGSTFVIR